jgi:hypothetical protein
MGTGTPFQKEAWTEYGIGTVIILLRILARAKVVGVKNWQGDDYFTIIALLFWTVSHMPAFPEVRPVRSINFFAGRTDHAGNDWCALNRVSVFLLVVQLTLTGQFGTNIGFTDAQRAAFSEEEIKVLARGSKCLLAGWTCYVTLIWSLKACMLFFYNRLTLVCAGIPREKIDANTPQSRTLATETCQGQCFYLHGHVYCSDPDHLPALSSPSQELAGVS